ncbi:MAG: M20/M25/M40 family metallo-hydrolase [Desulfobacterales bacterium]|nr:M20/M25/M40 family metallo-hydrolase [Desulfobacterales bacterium]
MLDELVPLLEQLIRFKSVADRPDEIEACAHWIEAWFTNEGVTVHRMDHNGVPSLWVTPEADACPALIMAHFDVVEGDASLFEPRHAEGKLYGRGACDDKYAVALGMILVRDWVKRLRSEGKSQTDLPFGLLLTGDEEVGGYNGACEALKRIRCNYCMALDGGCTSKVVVKEKGILRVNLTAKGKSAHGARPWLGVNAIDRLMEDLMTLREIFPPQKEAAWHRTLTIGRIEGGSSVNQVPAEARAFLDIRFTEEDDAEKLVGQMRGCVQSELEVVSVDPVFDGGKGEVTRYLANLAGDIEMGGEHGGSDARFLMPYHIPGVIWGANGNMSHHTENEHVTLASIEVIHGVLNRFFEAIYKGELVL